MIKEAFYMNKNVVVYSSSTCVYCKDAKDYLQALGVEYTEKNVSTDMVARKELIQKGFMGVPVIMIGEETIQGFDKGKIDELLK
jgi:glutaredoxin-like YruB-family protein